MSINVFTFTGNVGSDSELKHLDGGKQLLSFPVAVSSGFGERKTTFWVRCTKWGKGAEALSEYIKKGVSVTITGELSNRQYEKDGQQRTSLEVNVNDLAWSGVATPKADPNAAPAASHSAPAGDDNWDSDIPFS